MPRRRLLVVPVVVVGQGPLRPPLVLEGWTPGEEATISPPEAACRVTVQRFDAAGAKASVRATACPGGGGAPWTLEVQAR